MTEKEKKQFIIVNGLVLNEQNQILLVRRDRKWHKEAHGKWEFPGGKIDFGESPEEATIRETKEESGFDIEIERMIPKILSFKWDFPDRVSQQILICYVCKFIKGDACTDDHGVSDLKWFDPEEIKKLDCLPGTIDFLELFLGMKNAQTD